MRKGGYACGIQQVHQRHDPRRRDRGLLHTQVRQPQGGRQRQAIPDRSAQRPYRHDGAEGLGLYRAADRRRRGHRGQGAGYRGRVSGHRAVHRRAYPSGGPGGSGGCVRPGAHSAHRLRRGDGGSAPCGGLHYGPGLPCRGRGHAGGPRGDARAATARASAPSPPPRAYTMPFWAAC